MPAEILRGKPFADKIKEQVTADVEALKAKGVQPFLVAVQVGENADSKFYTDAQARVANSLGIKYELRELPGTTTQAELLSYIDGLNKDDSISGVILQMPVPEQCDAQEAQWAIAPDKDIEGVTPHNMGLVSFGTPKYVPCTALGAYELVKAVCPDITGKEVVVIGHSNIVGKPAGLLHLNDLGTVTTCHIGTAKAGMTPTHCQRADILIVAVGVPKLIKGDWVKEGAIVIDIGINTMPDGSVVGDVDFEAAKEKASYITPVPGGAGTMTTAILMRNVVAAAKSKAGM